MRKKRRVGDGGVPYRLSAVRSLCSFIAPVRMRSRLRASRLENGDFGAGRVGAHFNLAYYVLSA